jgi:hypothetical protein
MSIRIPKNKIKENKYTSGGEFIEEITNKEYKGYYCEFNNSFYSGKNFDSKSSLKLIKFKDRNKFLNNSSLAAFSLLKGLTSKHFQIPKINNIPTKRYLVSNNSNPQFYYTEINKTPTIIREIDEDTYKTIQKNPLYKTSYVGEYKGKTQTLNEADQQIPGLKFFLGG